MKTGSNICRGNNMQSGKVKKVKTSSHRDKNIEVRSKKRKYRTAEGFEHFCEKHF